jgi:pyruvate dehydrogenase E1 component alpha subunit
MKFAKDYSVKNGPLFVELHTYRYHGHSMSDPGITYRTRDEINEVRKFRDPIEVVRKMLIENKFAAEDELKEIEKKIRADIDAAVE